MSTEILYQRQHGDCFLPSLEDYVSYEYFDSKEQSSTADFPNNNHNNNQNNSDSSDAYQSSEIEQSTQQNHFYSNYAFEMNRCDFNEQNFFSKNYQIPQNIKLQEFQVKEEHEIKDSQQNDNEVDQEDFQCLNQNYADFDVSCYLNFFNQDSLQEVLQNQNDIQLVKKEENFDQEDEDKSQLIQHKKPNNKENQTFVRHRKTITKRRLPNKEEFVEVKQKLQSKKMQLKNHLKNFLKKCVPYLLKKLNSTSLCPKQRQLMIETLEECKDKTTKNDVLYLIRDFKDLKEISEDEFFKQLKVKNVLEKQNEDNHEAKFNPFYRSFRFINNKMENKESFEEFKVIVSALNILNSFNRCNLLQFCLGDYIPIIMYTKAAKSDQLFTKNYIMQALTNPSFIE